MAMSNPNTFINTYAANITEYVRLTEVLRTQNDQIVQDPTLVERYFAQTPDNVNRFLPPRTDITEEDVNAAKDAIVQMLFAYDSGSPTQKSHLYKMLP
jgi:hypothetical protein